jgi:hypothetical protein
MIYKINSGLPLSRRLELLNDMIIELSGLISKANFNKIEIDDIWDVLDSGAARTFSRNVGIGDTLATYTGWTCLKDETGYSIWKYSPTSYVYNSNNEFYIDNKLFVSKGEALSESATSFDNVLKYDPAAEESGETEWTDVSTEAGTEAGTQFNVCTETDEYLYIGLSSTFKGSKFEFQTRGSGYALKVEYFNGSAWIEMNENTNNLVDNTNNFESDGIVSWDLPADWAATTVNSITNKYWIRISTTSAPITTAKAYYIIPANNVIGLLALSSSEIFDEAWAWCSYGSSIYVTLPNAGATAYEGNKYITSSSSATNKQNFFVNNHSVTGNYATS